jgi:hypothetical protein
MRETRFIEQLSANTNGVSRLLMAALGICGGATAVLKPLSA